MTFVEKHTKVLAILLCLGSLAPLASTVQAYELRPGWHGEGKDRFYINEETKVPLIGINEIDGEVYHFGGDTLLDYGWVESKEDMYYFKEDGTAAQGRTKIQGTEYDFNKDGRLKQGWTEDKSGYYDDFGFLIKNKWKEVDNSTYYFDNNGNKKVGWSEVEKKKYYFNEEGKLAKGEYNIGDKTYSFDEETGEFKTGWIEEDKEFYYYDELGRKITNDSKEIDGKLYFFDEYGVMVKDSVQNGYQINDEGVAEKIQVVANATTQAVIPVEQENSVYPIIKPQQKPKPQESQISTTKSDIIASAAKSQIGVMQDCTMLVTNSLAAVGINFHGWPEEYLVLGTLTNNPVPGDIIVYSGHVAIYIGNGRAIHGGFYGNQTVEWSVSCSNTLIGYIHIN